MWRRNQTATFYNLSKAFGQEDMATLQPMAGASESKTNLVEILSIFHNYLAATVCSYNSYMLRLEWTAWWHNNLPWFDADLGLLSMWSFVCSLLVFVGFIWVLQFPPSAQKNHAVNWLGCSKNCLGCILYMTNQCVNV